MSPDEATLMAYADGELDPIAAKRFERALSDDPALAARLAGERALRARLTGVFAPLTREPVPAIISGKLTANVVPIHVPAPARQRWYAAAAIAAAVVVAIGVERISPDRTTLRAPAPSDLANVLDRDLSGGTGATRVMASFRAVDGDYCRVFVSRAIDGIACRDRTAGHCGPHRLPPLPRLPPIVRWARPQLA